MSALQFGEQSPYPFKTNNLTPPEPFNEPGQSLTVFEQRKTDDEMARRQADIDKALFHEEQRWENGDFDRLTRVQTAAAEAGKLLHFPSQAV